MVKEIEIVLRAVGKGCAAVEKETHCTWEWDELSTADKQGRFAAEDSLAPPTDVIDINGPFPACVQGCAASASAGEYRLVGQTSHFLIFAPAAS
jgi:hypothetical protein